MTYSSKDVTVIIVTFQSERWIGRCLTSVVAHAGRAVDIVVVDNGSTDGSVEIARRTAPQATVHILATNCGYTAAANLGTHYAHGRFFLFLNPDAELRADALSDLRSHLEQSPNVAAAGPRLMYPDGRQQDAAFTYPTLAMTWLEFFPRPARLLHSRLNGRLYSTDGRPIPIDYPLGACLLVRRAAWEDVGPFDEGFFLYCEEVDWCMRASRRGWTISHVPAAVVVHQGGASAQSAPGASLVHLYQSRRRLHRKHRPGWFRLLARLITCLGLAQERRRLLRGDPPSALDERIPAIERAMHLAPR